MDDEKPSSYYKKYRKTPIEDHRRLHKNKWEDPVILSVDELLIIFYNYMRAQGSSFVGRVDSVAEHHLIKRHLNKRFIVETKYLEPALYSCNLLDEYNRFYLYTDRSRLDFKLFISHIEERNKKVFDFNFNIFKDCKSLEELAFERKERDGRYAIKRLREKSDTEGPKKPYSGKPRGRPKRLPQEGADTSGKELSSSALKELDVADKVVETDETLNWEMISVPVETLEEEINLHEKEEIKEETNGDNASVDSPPLVEATICEEADGDVSLPTDD